MKFSLPTTRKAAAILGTTVLVAVCGSAATASALTTPSKNQVHACVHKKLLTVRIIDPAHKQHCSRVERSVSWNITGPKGATGATGAQGVKGSPGPAGAVGATGATGAKGDKGDPGPTGAAGATGPQGAKGDPGPAGTVGTAGAQGDKGDPGPTGAAGATGPQGEKGDKGEKGDSVPDSRFGTNTGNAFASTGTQCALGSVWLVAGRAGGGTPARGQLLNISQNTALFSLLENTYGGDGATTFALPDLRNAAPNGLTYVICTSGIFPALN